MIITASPHSVCGHIGLMPTGSSYVLVCQAVESIPYTRGLTNTGEMLNKVYTEMFLPERGDRDGVPNYLIVVTDGRATITPERVIPEAVFAKMAGVHILVVPIGKVRNYQVMEERMIE